MRNRIYILLIFFPLHLAASAQSKFKVMEEWDPGIVALANTAKDVAYLSEKEKEVYLLTNLARLKGKLFAETFLKAYLDTTKRKYTKTYVASLKKDLKNSPELSPYKVGKILYDEAKNHSDDMGKSGKIGHAGSNGTKPADRFKNVTKTYQVYGENCHYGSDDPLLIVLELLIDNKV